MLYAEKPQPAGNTPVSCRQGSATLSPTTTKPEGAEPRASRPSALFSKRFRIAGLEALAFRDFRLLWFGHCFASTAFWMDQVTRGWLIYELTNSALQLGLVRGIQAIPTLLLSPLAGSLADRYSRKAQIVLAQVADGLMFAALAALIVTERIEVWHVYATAFGMAAVQTFQQPARGAIVADAVPPSRLTNAIGLNSIVFNVARSTGPALAGILISRFGTGGCYAVQAAFYILATFWTARLQAAGRPAPGRHGAGAPSPTLGRSIIEGWQFSWRTFSVRTALLVVMFASLFIVPFTTLLPVFARDLLGVGATGQGLLLTAMGIGALGSAMMIAFVGDRLRRGLFMLAGVALYGVSVVAFSVSPWFWASMALMVIVGFANVCSHALVQTVIQSYSPSEFRGRTMAVFHMSGVVLTVGSMLIGVLATLLGPRWAVALMGAAGAAAMAAIHFALPGARHIR
ncbi:MAG TPA: MFS transporter [candidate division Zixibacteria bacterium]|nr:MFS transporter [candidate division Zixibacteria bacterium]